MKSALPLTLFSFLPLLLPIATTRAAGSADDYVEIKQGATELLTILESLPYAAEGEGPVMYMFEFSECSYCQAKYRDFRGQNLGLEFRRLFVPVSDRAARETAALGLSRDPADYHAFMQRSKVAPAFDRNNAAIDVHNAIVAAASRNIPPILIRNGWSARGLVYPAYFWIEDGKVFANGGYEKANFMGAVTRARTGWNDASIKLLADITGPSAGAPGASAVAAAGPTASPESTAATRASTPALPLDATTAFFIFHKLTGQTPDFEQLAGQTNAVLRAPVFNKARLQAQEAATLRALYEAADPTATYVIGVQTRLNYQLDQQQFEVEMFREGSVLPLQPFRDSPHMMSQNNYRHYGVRLAFANSDAAHFIPLGRERARVIDSVAQHGVTGAAAEVRFRFIDAANTLPRTARAEIESVRYNYDRRIVGFVPMSNPALWPLQDTVTIEAVDHDALASAPRPLDSLTALFLYHKLAGEPLDFDTIARGTHTVERTRLLDRDKAAADMAATLREKFDAADPAATYTISMRTSMQYDTGHERYAVETFGPDRYLPMVPFRPQGGVLAPHAFTNMRLADQYNRRLMFLNADAARHVPLDSASARTGALGAGGTVVVEVNFTLVDTEDSAMDANKTLRAQITSVQYSPGIGRITATWPFPQPIAVAAAEVPAAGEGSRRIDDLTVFYLHHKLAGEPIDFEGIAGMLQTVARAGQFDKAEVQAAEVAKMKAGYDAADPDATYTVRVRSNLKYDLEQERFEVELFAPGRHLLYRPVTTLGVDSRHSVQARLYDRKLAFANGESARYIALPRGEAAKIGNVAQSGTTGAAAEIELRFVGTGDPTGAVEGRNVVRAEILAMRFDGLDLPVAVKPYDPKALPVKPVNAFDIVGLKTGVSLATLQRTIEKEFGPIGAIRPGNNEDPRLVSGIGHNADGCFSFGNKVAEVGNVCIRAFADERGTVRKIIVEQILDGGEWEPVREALLAKYGAMSESVSKSNNRYFAWGPEVVESVTSDDRLAPPRALTAGTSAVQSAMDRMAASTRVSTNLRIRLIDPDWAGSPAPEVSTPATERPAASVPRL